MFFFVDAKKGKKQAFEVKSKFLLYFQTQSVFTHYIQNSRQSASKYIFYRILEGAEYPCGLLKKMAVGRAKIFAIGASVKLPITYVIKDGFNYVIF